MKFSPSKPLLPQEISYSNWLISENEKWAIVTREMIFGRRISEFPKNAYGPEIDYCCGTDATLLGLVRAPVLIILESFPENAPLSNIRAAFPDYDYKPINRDPTCLPLLMERAGLVLPPGLHQPDPFAVRA